MRDERSKATGPEDASLSRALHILLELSKMVPDLERALVLARQAADAGGAR